MAHKGSSLVAAARSGKIRARLRMVVEFDAPDDVTAREAVSAVGRTQILRMVQEASPLFVGVVTQPDLDVRVDVHRLDRHDAPRLLDRR